MTSRITYLELLQMVKDGKGPEAVEAGGRTFAVLNGSYRNACLETIEHELAKRYTTNGFATVPCITVKEKILTDAEERYLSAVIEPFRDRVDSIRKATFGDRDWITIQIKGDPKIGVQSDCTALPYFARGTKYVGMVSNKEYTLWELGL